MLYMGLDVGTQGVRCVTVNEIGELIAAQSIPFERLNTATQPGLYEQSPADWARAVDQAIGACTQTLAARGIAPDAVRAISIDGTSGTIVPLGSDWSPLSPALMYNDPRAKAQAARAHEALCAHERKMGLRFGTSFSLPRILWIRDNWPDVYEKTRVFAHQADYIAGLICGEYQITDYSNALKTGYDLIDGRWPEEISGALGLDADKLARVIQPGAPIARVSAAAAAKLGLSTKTMVVGGSTDGYASALAAGAVRAGNWASIIGTTFVLKGVTDRLIIDPNGSSYSHRLPSGEWLLGGASNLGGRCLNAYAEGRDFAALDRASERLIPTQTRCYPLTGKGERFPFVDGEALPFYIGDIWGGRLYPALMEGVGFAEKMAFDRMRDLGCPVGEDICTTGGACRSALWLRIRASILNKRLLVPRIVDAAMGSALVAASASFGSLSVAAKAMIRYDKAVEPDQALVAPYAQTYEKFLDDCRRNYHLED